LGSHSNILFNILYNENEATLLPLFFSGEIPLLFPLEKVEGGG